MAGLCTTRDDQFLTGGIVIGVWLAGLAVLAVVSSLMHQGVTTPAAALPEVATPSIAPVETLPPTVVVVERDEVYPADCRPGEHGIGDGHCASPSPRLDVADEP